MKRLFLLALSAVLIMPAFSAEKNDLTADKILAQVRYATKLQKDQTINGKIRNKSMEIPFGIQLKSANICFNYSEDGQNWKTFELRFKQKGQELFSYENGKTTPFPVKRYNEKINGSDITFEDLSFRFLYWPGGKILPEDRTSYIKGQKCFVLDLPNPSPGTGEYAWIRAWVGEETGALWQIDAFDQKGRHLKRFTITSVMKTKDTWFFEQMRVELRDPDNPKKTRGVNYIELKND